MGKTVTFLKVPSTRLPFKSHRPEPHYMTTLNSKEVWGIELFNWQVASHPKIGSVCKEEGGIGY